MDALPARVRAFVVGSATTGASVFPLRSYYVSLQAEGWLVELARAHGRAVLGAWTHDDFAAWLGLRGEELGRAYRAMLRRDGGDREELVQLARRLLKAESVDFLQRSPEMLRFRRAREDAERRANTIGRPTKPLDDAVGPLGQQIERWRVDVHVAIDDWAAGLGISPSTYRARLAHEMDKARTWQQKITELVRDSAQLHRKLAAPTVARYDVVTPVELGRAYQVVADDLERMRATMLSEHVEEDVVAAPDAPSEDFLPLDLYGWLPREERPTEEGAER